MSALELIGFAMALVWAYVNAAFFSATAQQFKDGWTYVDAIIAVVCHSVAAFVFAMSIWLIVKF